MTTRSAACADTGLPDSFFPSAYNPAKVRAVIRAFCDRCPVRKECLQLGLDTGSQGIWGGEYLTGDPYKLPASDFIRRPYTPPLGDQDEDEVLDPSDPFEMAA